MNEPVTIDPEFQSLIPPLSEDEYRQLEENCKRDGILDSLKVWKGILIDGHNRYRIAEEWDLNYEICRVDLPDREAVKAWIANNQLGRRNVDDLTRIKLARIAKPEIVKEAEKRTGGRPKNGEKPVMKSSQDSERENKTRYKLAKAAGVGEQKFHQGEVILDSGNEKLIAQVQSGEKSINQAYNEIRNKEIKRLPTAKEYREQVQERHDDFKEQKTVSLESIKQDKQDKDFLADEVKRDILKATERVNELYVMVMEKEIDISLLTKNGKTKVLHEISECQRQLGIIQEKIERSR